MAVHRQLAIRTLRLINIQRRLQRLAQPDRDFLLQLGFQLIQQPHGEHPPRPARCPYPRTKPPKSERYHSCINLTAGVNDVQVEKPHRPSGLIPDITLLKSKLNPPTFIEVQVTSPASARKIDYCRQHGIDL